MNTRIRKRKIRWGRVAILVMALLLIAGGIFKVGSYIAVCFEEHPAQPVVLQADRYRHFYEVTIKEGDTMWDLLKKQGYPDEEIPALIFRVEFANTAKFGWRDPWHLTPGEVWIFPKQ